MRTQLLSAITTAISTLTQFAVVSELPFESSGQPLYRKNMKRVYVDQEYRVEKILYPVLNGSNVMQDQLIAMAYVACDAKNPPTQLDSLVSRVLAAKDSTNVIALTSESDYTVDKQEDVLIYAFEFRFDTIQ
jgi:hypothetical protein